MDQVLAGMIGEVPQGEDRVSYKPAPKEGNPQGRGASREDHKNTITKAGDGKGRLNELPSIAHS